MKPDVNLTNRIDSVVNLAGHWKSTMPKKPKIKEDNDAKWREWDGLKSALGLFMDFANDYKTILISAPLPNLKFVVNRGTEKILQGFSILSRACEQRRGRTTSSKSLAQFLAQAEDQLDIFCLQWRAMEFGEPYLKLSTPVVYFEKLYGISRSLYGPEIPIISIPLTLYNQPDRWQALAHEMGHHIYWNAIDDLDDVSKFHQALATSIRISLDGVIHTATKKNQQIWENWAEEVFADVCGTLLAGPEYVISCQNTASERARKPSDLAVDDDEHPAPYLRPLITLRVLRELNGDTADEEITKKINAIEQRWTNYSPGIDAESVENIHNKPDNKEIQLKLSDFSAQIKPVVHAILFNAIWPFNKKLLDLIQPYRKDSYNNILLEELDKITPINSGRRGIEQTSRPIPAPNDSDIPDSMKELWKFIKGNELFPGRPGENENVEAQWESLLDLSLEETHTHIIPHPQCIPHFLIPKHYHDAVGQQISC